MFIIDEFAFLDAAGKPTGRTLSPQASAHTSQNIVARALVHLFFFLSSFPFFVLLFQIGGGGTYANIGARIW
jgi:hypothetical protein